MARRYLIAILLPTQISQRIDVWRARYYPYGIKSVPPHLTIIPPFNSDIDAKILYTKVEQYIKSVSKFGILIKGFDQFTQHSNVFFAKVLPSMELERLHQTIRLCLDDCGVSQLQVRPRSFHPHITIASGLSAQQLLDIKKELSQELIDESITVNQISLLIKQDGRYQVQANWVLDKNKGLQYDAKAD